MSRSGGSPCNQADPRWRHRYWNRSRCDCQHNDWNLQKPRKMVPQMLLCCLAPQVVMLRCVRSVVEVGSSSPASVVR